MTRTHFLVAFVASIPVAFFLLLLAAWVTDGSSPTQGKGALFEMALVFPMIFAAKAGLDRSSALFVAFAAYLVVVFACLVWYIVRRNSASRDGPKL